MYGIRSLQGKEKITSLELLMVSMKWQKKENIVCKNQISARNRRVHRMIEQNLSQPYLFS